MARVTSVGELDAPLQVLGKYELVPAISWARARRCVHLYSAESVSSVDIAHLEKISYTSWFSTVCLSHDMA